MGSVREKTCEICGYMAYLRKRGEKTCPLKSMCCDSSHFPWEYFRTAEPAEVPLFEYDAILNLHEMIIHAKPKIQEYIRVSICDRGIDVQTEHGTTCFAVDWSKYRWQPEAYRRLMQKEREEEANAKEG